VYIIVIHVTRPREGLLILLRPLTGRCHVIELDKRRLFIYSPWTKSGLLLIYSPLFTYTLTGLFANNVFSFYALSYSMPYDMTPLSQLYVVCLYVCMQHVSQ
jgi:hypothetical protein